MYFWSHGVANQMDLNLILFLPKGSHQQLRLKRLIATFVSACVNLRGCEFVCVRAHTLSLLALAPI